MENEKTKRIHIHMMPESLYRRLKARAAEEGIPIYKLALRYIEEGLNRWTS